MPVNWPWPEYEPSRCDRRHPKLQGKVGRPQRDRKKIAASRRAARRSR